MQLFENLQAMARLGIAAASAIVVFDLCKVAGCSAISSTAASQYSKKWIDCLDLNFCLSDEVQNYSSSSAAFGLEIKHQVAASLN